MRQSTLSISHKPSGGNHPRHERRETVNPAADRTIAEHRRQPQTRHDRSSDSRSPPHTPSLASRRRPCAGEARDPLRPIRLQGVHTLTFQIHCIETTPRGRRSGYVTMQTAATNRPVATDGVVVPTSTKPTGASKRKKQEAPGPIVLANTTTQQRHLHPDQPATAGRLARRPGWLGEKPPFTQADT